MTEFLALIANSVVLNNVILIVFMTLFIYAFWKENKSDESPVRWTDLLLDHKTQKLSLAKFGSFWGIFLSSWVVMYLTQKPDSYGYLIPIFGIWLSFLAGSHAYDKWLKSKLEKEEK